MSSVIKQINKGKTIKIALRMFSDYSAVKLEINNREVTKSPNTGKLKHILLSNPQV